MRPSLFRLSFSSVLFIGLVAILWLTFWIWLFRVAVAT
jgi:hypothetical protein